MLNDLDVEIEKCDEYADRLESRMAAMKFKCLSAESDSLRWVVAHEIVTLYRYSNLDSMARYVELEKRFATGVSQKVYSAFDDICEMALRGNDRRAAAMYHKFDTGAFSDEEYMEYLRLGYEIFKHDKNSRGELEAIRLEMLQKDTLSYAGIKNISNYDCRRGNHKRAIDRLLHYLQAHHGCVEESSVYFNIATAYGEMGNQEQEEEYLAYSAMTDIRNVHRDFQSLYKLALLRLEDRDFERASRYIDVHYKVLSEGYFYPRLLLSGSAVGRISSEYISTQDRTRLMMVLSSVLILLFAMISFSLFRRNRRKSASLEAANRDILEAQEKLAVTNRIKENYVSRYMMLARRYLDNSASQRHEFKRILKENGPDELYRKLKQVDKEYVSEKEFYRVFDEAFLSIFPDFVHQVNSLLRPEAAFDETTRSLPTEIRILAVIRLGITSSPDIAAFLNCSLNTVYAYRGKIRNNSIVGKDGIEEIIARINS